VKARLNVLISGGTGSGKTTLLNVLSALIPSVERLITIEDAAELALPRENLVALEARPRNVEGAGQVSIRDLLRNALRMLFRTAALEAEAFSSADAFLEDADLTRRCCVLLDIRMPGMTGTALHDLDAYIGVSGLASLHDELLRRGIRVPIIFITGHGDIPMAVEAMRKGAFDFIEKPFDDEQLLARVREALEQQHKPEVGSVPLSDLS
jgi:CheY-like chemotaxis protein